MRPCPKPVVRAVREVFTATAFVLSLGVSSVAGPLPEPGFPQCLGVQLKPESFTVETLDQAHAMGFRIVRRGFYWNAVEKEKGTYTFEAYDAQMAHAKELGLTVIGCLFGGNKLYEDHGRGGVLTEEGRQGFAAFAAAAAAHYKGQPILWEVWNEPNVRTFWRKDGTHNTVEFAEEYTALVKAVVPAMLQADPEAFVLAGSVSNYWEPSYQWTEFCFQKGILATGIRGWSVHPYGVKTPEEHAIGHQRTRELLAKYGAPDLPMVNTERGYSASKTLTGEGWSGGEAAKLLEYQAGHFVRQVLVDQLCGVRFSSWYEWGGNEGFGLWNPDGAPRPTVAALKELVEQLGGFHIVRRLESDSALDYVVLCADASGARKLVAWTAPAPGGSPDETWDHAVSVDLGAAAPALALALTGRPQYAALPAGAEPGKAVTTTPKPVAAPVDASIPAGATDLKLFEAGAEWSFVKNTGTGTFTLGADADGTPMGILAYDFSGSSAKGRPYVLVHRPMAVAAGATALTLNARSGIAQQLTFRVSDETGQTLQFKSRLKGTGQWEPIRIPLDKKLEHWEGANDGKVHFPLKSLTLSVPQPSDEVKVGKVEYAAASVVGGGAVEAPAAPAAEVPQPAAGTATAKLFDGSIAWKFMKNTGEGSFDLANDADGKSIGVMAFDFTQSKTGGTPYVLAAAPVLIPGGTELVLPVRTAVPQKLTFRLNDATGQTLQFKAKAAGTGQWEEIRIPMNRKLEHWEGADDGQVHFPVKTLTLSVPRPSPDVLKGKVEYAEAVVK